MRRGALFLMLGVLLLAALAAWTIACIAPTEVRGSDAPATEFSAARAVTHIEAIAKTPHPVGSPAHEEVRAYILGVLASLGLETRVEESNAALRAAGVVHAAHVKNVIARWPGTRPGPAILMAAHYDSVPRSRGASDDGSGVATLLETARALVASPRMQNDVVFLFSDAEEVAACGAFAFTEEELQKQPIGVALNFEARGTRGAVALYDTSENNGALIRAVARTVPRVVSTSLLGSLARALPNDSDASVFKRAGIPTYAFAYVDHLYQYHQYTDSLDALDLRSLQHDGDYALPLVRYLGNQPLPMPSSSAVAYFDVFGRAVVSYSTLVARGLALVTLAFFVVLVQRTYRKDKLSLRRVLLSAAVACGAVLLSGAAAGLVHGLLRLMVDPFVLFARPHVAMAGSLVLGMAAFLFLYSRVLRSGDVRSSVFGALCLWALLLLLTAVFVPVASFVFQWPLLFALGGTAFWLARRETDDTRVDVLVVAMLAPATFFWSYLAYTLFVMVGAQAPEVVVLAVALPMLLALPLLARVGTPLLRHAAVALAAISVIIVVVGAILIHKSPDLPRPDSLVYLFEKNHHSARWTTNEPEHDAFVTQRIPQGLVSAPAELYDLAPLVTTTHSVDEDGQKHTTLTVASPAHARCVRLWEVTTETMAKVRVNDVLVRDVVRFSPETDAKIVRLFAGGGRPASWVMEYCGADEAGFKVDLFSPRGKHVRLRIIEVSDGVPGPPLSPRSPADGYPENDSDITEAMVDVSF